VLILHAYSCTAVKLGPLCQAGFVQGGEGRLPPYVLHRAAPGLLHRLTGQAVHSPGHWLPLRGPDPLRALAHVAPKKLAMVCASAATPIVLPDKLLTGCMTPLFSRVPRGRVQPAPRR
jgi:hypothetical protein